MRSFLSRRATSSTSRVLHPASGSASSSSSTHQHTHPTQTPTLNNHHHHRDNNHHHRLISQQKRCQSSSAAASSSAAGSAAIDQLPKELRFYMAFDQSEQDLHFELLEEANLKHGVFLNVPPQLPPDGTPPEVPEPIIGPATMARLSSLTLAYAPTHDPPPFATAGTRGIDNILIAGPTTPTPTPSGSAATPSSSGSAPSAAPKEAASDEPATVSRKPIDAEAKFHCSLCAKPFRIRLSGTHHVSTAHGTRPSPSAASPSASPAAELLPGPGPGEIDNTAAAPSPSPSSSAATSPSGTLRRQASDYAAAELALPTDAEIEDLLTDVWDAMGLKLKIKDFKQSNAVVAGVADKRSLNSGADKPSSSATPAGVAPGIKRTAATGSTPLSPLGRAMTIKEMSARYQSPFGDSDLFADFEEDDNRNPFLPVEEVSAASATAAGGGKDIDGSAAASKGKAAKSGLLSISSSSIRPKNSFDLTNTRNSEKLAKKLTCHLCGAKCRLLDSLHTHYEEEHGTTMPDDVLRASLAVSPTAALYEGKVPSARAEAVAAKAKADAAAAGGGSGGDGAAGGGGGESSSSTAGGGGSTSSGGGGSSDQLEGLPIPVEEAEISIHMRAQSNTVLIGDVVEVKRGYIKTHAVTQLIIKVSHEREEGAAAEEEKQQNNNSVEEDLITVRCYGDVFGTGILSNEIRVGAQLMVHGTLRLNRRLDKVSNRVHCFPYVMVTTPQGSVQSIE